MKKLIPLLLTVCLLLGATPALAATPQVKSSMVIAPNTLQTIQSGGSTLIDNLDGTMNISGYTSAYYPVSQLGLVLHLQYYSDTGWVTLKTFYYYGYDTSYLTGGQHLAISRGYYYRVSAEHTSYDGGISEQTLSYSDSLYVP